MRHMTQTSCQNGKRATGSASSAIPVKEPPNLENIDDKLSCVIDMATARARLPISTIRKVYQSKMYVRVDEILIALAYCSKKVHSEELRTLANTEAITLINDQADFLLFAHYYKKVAAILRGDGHTHFAHVMCRVIEKWYEKYSPVELANMFGEHRGLHGLTHQSIIKKADMRTKKRTPPNAIAAPNSIVSNSNAISNTEAVSTVEKNANVIENTSAPSTSDAGALNLAAQNANTPMECNDNDATAAVEPAPVSSLSSADDREHVFQFVFCNGSQEYLKYLEDKPELGAGAQRLKQLQILKINESIDSVIESIRRHKFTLDQLPAHLLEKQEIWKALLPTLTSRTLLKHFHTLKDLGFLNEDSPFTRSFLDVFGQPGKFNSEQVCPIYLYIQKKLYSRNMRYLGVKKSEYYEKKVQKRKVRTNPLIESRLNGMFSQALFSATPAPANFSLSWIYAGIMRKENRKLFDIFNFIRIPEFVVRNKQINCFEAAFLLAYSTFVREKDTLVYSFTDSKDRLEPLHGIMPKNNFDMAKEAVVLQTLPCTNQSLPNPIAEATTLKKNVDMFVVIVDSVARFCRQGQVPEEEFTEYRKKFNNAAKYVVINLSRSKPDLKIPQTDNMRGFFEIASPKFQHTADTKKIGHSPQAGSKVKRLRFNS